MLHAYFAFVYMFDSKLLQPIFFSVSAFIFTFYSCSYYPMIFWSAPSTNLRKSWKSNQYKKCWYCHKTTSFIAKQIFHLSHFLVLFLWQYKNMLRFWWLICISLLQKSYEIGTLNICSFLFYKWGKWEKTRVLFQDFYR